KTLDVAVKRPREQQRRLECRNHEVVRLGRNQNRFHVRASQSASFPSPCEARRFWGKPSQSAPQCPRVGTVAAKRRWRQNTRFKGRGAAPSRCMQSAPEENSEQRPARPAQPKARGAPAPRPKRSYSRSMSLLV